MTFNRYICFRAILESIGAIACMLMALIGNNLLGVIVAAIAALLWIGGEVWGMTVFRRQNRDATSFPICIKARPCNSRWSVWWAFW